MTKSRNSEFISGATVPGTTRILSNSNERDNMDQRKSALMGFFYNIKFVMGTSTKNPIQIHFLIVPISHLYGLLQNIHYKIQKHFHHYLL
jgi:hypothetical protein